MVQFADALRWVVASSATSYGYTLTIWATSAVVLHHRGIPTEASVLAFVLGAIGGFAVVGLIANWGRPRASPPDARSFRIWQALHLLSVALPIGGAAIITRLFHSWIAWPASGFTATATYLVVVAAQHSFRASSNAR